MMNMDVIKTPTTIERPIYRAEFKYTARETKNIQEFNDTEIQKGLTGNIVEVGEPERCNIKELCKRKKIKLPLEIEILCNDFDFWLIQSVYSFMPAIDNYFDSARIVAKMEPLSNIMKNPIAYDAYPRDIYEEKKEKRRISIGLSFKFAEIIEPKAEYVQEIEFTRLEPIIDVAGIGKSNPIWAFRGRAAFNIRGVNSIYIIVKTPINSDGIKIDYFFYAYIHNKYLGIIPTTAKKIMGKETYEIKLK